jgi:hypothetical protein
MQAAAFVARAAGQGGDLAESRPLSDDYPFRVIRLLVGRGYILTSATAACVAGIRSWAPD